VEEEKIKIALSLCNYWMPFKKRQFDDEIIPSRRRRTKFTRNQEQVNVSDS
jgi:hypothetical protein